MKTLKTAWSRAKRVHDKRNSWNMRVYFFFVLRIYREYTWALRAPPSLLSVPLAWKEPLNARGEPSVVVYLHNLWGSKNAKKLISRPRHRPPPSLRLPASSLVYTCSTLRSSPFTTSTTSSSFALGPFARVFPVPWKLCPGSSLKFALISTSFVASATSSATSPLYPSPFSIFFSAAHGRRSPCCDFIMSWQEVSHKSRCRLAFSSSSDAGVF